MGESGPVQMLVSSPVWLLAAPQGWRPLPQLVAGVSDFCHRQKVPGAQVVPPAQGQSLQFRKF